MTGVRQANLLPGKAAEPPKEPPGPPRRARRTIEIKGLDERFFFGVPDRFFLEKEMVWALRGSAKPSVPCGDESPGGSRKQNNPNQTDPFRPQLLRRGRVCASLSGGFL